MRDYVYGGLAPDEPVGHIDEDKVVRGGALLEAIGAIDGTFLDAIGPVDGDGSEGIVNYRFVPGAGANS
jgi:hypothetical protein